MSHNIVSGLEEVFDLCPWQGKHKGSYPAPDAKIVFRWLADESDFAHSMLCSGVLQEDTPVLTRTLHLGQDNRKRPVLCVVETDKKYDIREVAEKVAAMFDPSRIVWPKA